MSKFRTIALIAAVLGVGASGLSVTPAAAQEEFSTQSDFASFQALFDYAIERLKADDPKGAAEYLQRVARHPRFADMPSELHYAVYSLLSYAHYLNGETRAAYDRQLQAGVMSPTSRDADYWLTLADIATDLQREDEAIDAVIRAARDFPEALKAARAEYVYSMVGRADLLEDDGARHFQLLEALHAGGYVSENPFMPEELIWFELFEAYVAKGDTEKATTLAKGFVTPVNLIRLSIDKRYMPFTVGGPDRFDLKAAAERGLKYKRDLSEKSPKLLEGIDHVAFELSQINRSSEALKLIDATLKTIEAAPDDMPAFEDEAEHLSWLLDTRNTVLSRLGRWDEAEKAQIKARDHALKAGEDIVSQKIHLAVFYYLQGRATEALEEIEGVDLTHTSRYGIMSVEEVRACAYAQMGESEKLKASLEFMSAQAKTGYSALRAALMCAGDLDALAALVISRLDDPRTRNDTLLDWQTYLPEPHPTAYMQKLTGVRTALLARADVKAAVDRYGVILNIPMMDIAD